MCKDILFHTLNLPLLSITVIVHQSNGSTPAILKPLIILDGTIALLPSRLEDTAEIKFQNIKRGMEPCPFSDLPINLYEDAKVNLITHQSTILS